MPAGIDGPGGSALFLVFRGTKSINDITNDLMAMPKTAPNGQSFHEGFLRAVEADNALHEQMRRHFAGPVPVYIVGHVRAAQDLTSH